MASVWRSIQQVGNRLFGSTASTTSTAATNTMASFYSPTSATSTATTGNWFTAGATTNSISINGTTAGTSSYTISTTGAASIIGTSSTSIIGNGNSIQFADGYGTLDLNGDIDITTDYIKIDGLNHFIVGFEDSRVEIRGVDITEDEKIRKLMEMERQLARMKEALDEAVYMSKRLMRGQYNETTRGHLKEMFTPRIEAIQQEAEAIVEEAEEVLVFGGGGYGDDPRP